MILRNENNIVLKDLPPIMSSTEISRAGTGKTIELITEET